MLLHPLPCVLRPPSNAAPPCQAAPACTHALPVRACACAHAHRVAKFNGVHTLDILLSGSFGADCSEVHFVGLKGEFSEVGAAQGVAVRSRGTSKVTWCPGGAPALQQPSMQAAGCAPSMPACAPRCFFPQRKRVAVEAVYEARAIPTDHKVPGDRSGAAWGS